MTLMHLCKTTTASQLRLNCVPTDVHKWPSVIMPFIKINSAAIISGSPLSYTSLRWPMRQRQMIGMLHAALKLLSWFFRWPTQIILYEIYGNPQILLIFLKLIIKNIKFSTIPFCIIDGLPMILLHNFWYQLFINFIMIMP